ncbi:MAG: RIP metalloprotease RseP [Abditibacteriota bacterium]|nr:RIP metalloprotease RseP [Abditibacteriota bacterium]
MILTIITFIIMLSVLVVVHEYGHFIVARLCGVEIKEFAIGFGPKLFTWLRKNGTDFTVRAFPLGGFVSMKGESIEEMDVEGGFQSMPPWKRFLVVFAGPFFSFLFAVLIFISIGWTFGFPTGDTSNKIQMVFPQTKASAIGLRAGDEIISINGIKSVKGSYVDIIHDSAGEEMTLLIKRGNKELTFKAAPDLMVRFLGVNTKENPAGIGVLFDSVDRESDLYKQGVVSGDILISVNGVDIDSTNELKDYLENYKEEEISFVVQSGKKLRTVNVPYLPFYYETCGAKLYLPEFIFVTDIDKEAKYGIKTGDELLKIDDNKITDNDSFLKFSQGQVSSVTVKRDEEEKVLNINDYLSPNPVYYIAVGAFGFFPAPMLEKTGFWDSIKIGCGYIGRIIVELFRVLTSREIKDNVGGPIAIVSATNSAVNTGFFSIVLLTAGLSLSLAILNLLPIPVLDGGHIFVLFLEFVRRKRFTKEELGVIQAIGLLIIIFIFVAVMYSDISKLFTDGLPK